MKTKLILFLLLLCTTKYFAQGTGPQYCGFSWGFDVPIQDPNAANGNYINFQAGCRKPLGNHGVPPHMNQCIVQTCGEETIYIAYSEGSANLGTFLTPGMPIYVFPNVPNSTYVIITPPSGYITLNLNIPGATQYILAAVTNGCDAPPITPNLTPNDLCSC